MANIQDTQKLIDQVDEIKVEDRTDRTKEDTMKKEFETSADIMKRLPKFWDPDAIPPDFKLAQDYRMATSVGIPLKGQEDERCRVTARPIYKEYLKWNCPDIKLSFLGSGFPLFFFYQKALIVLFLFIFVILGEFSIITNSISSNCIDFETAPDDKSCKLDFTSKMSLGNKSDNDELMTVQSYLDLFVVVFLIFMFQFMRKHIREVDQQCDAEDVNPQDYTVVVNNIPLKIEADDYDDDLKQFLQEENKLIPGMKVTCAEISMCYRQELIDKELKTMDELHQKKSDMEDFRNDSENDQYEDVLKFEQLNEEIVKQRENINSIQGKFFDANDKEFMHQQFAGKAFVSFNKESTKNKVLQRAKKMKLMYHNQRLKITDSAYPTDIFWRYLYLTPAAKRKRKFYAFLVTVFIFCVCFALIVFLLIVQHNVSLNPDYGANVVAFIAIIMTSAISVLNVILEIVISKLSYVEGNITKTEYNSSLATKLIVLKFVNSVVIYLVAQLAIMIGDDSYYNQFFKEGGICYNQTFQFLTNAVVPGLVEYINIPTHIATAKRNLIRRNQERCTMTQQELLLAYEKPPFQIEKFYTTLINTTFMGMFYASIIPFGLVCNIFGLMFYFYAIKRNLVQSRKIPPASNSKMTTEMVEILEFSLPLFCAGNFIFYYLILNQQTFKTNCIPSCIGLVISVIHLSLDMDAFNEYIFPIDNDQENEQTYIEALPFFRTDFKRENPVFQKLAIDTYNLNYKDYALTSQTIRHDRIVAKQKKELDAAKVEAQKREEKLKNKNKAKVNPKKVTPKHSPMPAQKQQLVVTQEIKDQQTSNTPVERRKDKEETTQFNKDVDDILKDQDTKENQK